MIHNSSLDTQLIRVINATAAGTTAINGAAVDTFGFDGVQFAVAVGALTATQVTSIKAQYSDDGLTNWTDVAGSNCGPLLDADSNKVLRLDIFKPRQRYVRVVVLRATANAVVDAGFATLYLSHRSPVTQDASIGGAAGTGSFGNTAGLKVLNNPVTGTP